MLSNFLQHRSICSEKSFCENACFGLPQLLVTFIYICHVFTYFCSVASYVDLAHIFHTGSSVSCHNNAVGGLSHMTSTKFLGPGIDSPFPHRQTDLNCPLFNYLCTILGHWKLILSLFICLQGTYFNLPYPSQCGCHKCMLPGKTWWDDFLGNECSRSLLNC